MLFVEQGLDKRWVEGNGPGVGEIRPESSSISTCNTLKFLGFWIVAVF